MRGPDNFELRKDGIVLFGTGAVLYSNSGRKLSPVPLVDCSTPGKRVNTLKRVAAWVLSEARAEAHETGQHFLAGLLKAIDLRNCSEADMDTMNLALFGDALGALERNTKPGQGVTPTPDPVLLRDLSAPCNVVQNCLSE